MRPSRWSRSYKGVPGNGVNTVIWTSNNGTELWKALKETVKKWEQESDQFSEVRFACDWA